MTKQSTLIKDLLTKGHHASCPSSLPFLGPALCARMREEATRMFEGGQHFFQSQSTAGGVAFDKEGVYACELDGTPSNWRAAPCLLEYTRAMVLSLPPLLAPFFPATKLSSSLYGSKLANATGGGSKYPKHIDNIGSPDRRKLTVIYYLNPDWDTREGGELRVWDCEPSASRGDYFTSDDDNTSFDLPSHGHTDVAPEGDRVVMFWSDLCVHEVLANSSVSPSDHRYALTLWFVSEDDSDSCILQPHHSLYRQLHDQHF